MLCILCRVGPVVAIIQKSMSTGESGENDEIEIDIDKLNIATLRELQDYVRKALNNLRKKSIEKPKNNAAESAAASNFNIEQSGIESEETTGNVTQISSNSLGNKYESSESESESEDEVAAPQPNIIDFDETPSSAAADVQMNVNTNAWSDLTQPHNSA
jgi:hypothetical protein